MSVQTVETVVGPAVRTVVRGRLSNSHGATVHPSMLQPGDIVFEEPDVDIGSVDVLTAENTDTAAVIVADANGTLYVLPLKGAVRGADRLPHGILQPVYASSRLFTTHSHALLAQAESERSEAAEHIRLAEQLEELAAELKSQNR